MAQRGGSLTKIKLFIYKVAHTNKGVCKRIVLIYGILIRVMRGRWSLKPFFHFTA